MITKKDIQNIRTKFNLLDKAIKHPNDAKSVDLWVNEMRDNEFNDCILIYKKQGDLTESIGLSKEDFLLGIMTLAQKEILKKFGNNGIICMDAMHGTNPYDFNLITILTVDDFGEGFPVAFLISNREDYIALKYFIMKIKDKSGDIKAKIFMSDDAEQYFST